MPMIAEIQANPLGIKWLWKVTQYRGGVLADLRRDGLPVLLGAARSGAIYT